MALLDLRVIRVKDQVQPPMRLVLVELVVAPVVVVSLQLQQLMTLVPEVELAVCPEGVPVVLMLQLMPEQPVCLEPVVLVVWMVQLAATPLEVRLVLELQVVQEVPPQRMAQLHFLMLSS
jgi:hypothetical protein